MRKRVLGMNHLHRAASHHYLAGLYISRETPEKAEPLSKQALKIYENLMGPDHTVTGPITGLGVVYIQKGQYDKAESYFQKVLAIHERIEGPEHPATAATLMNLANLYVDQGRFSEAESLLVRAVKSITIITIEKLVELYEQTGDKEQADKIEKMKNTQSFELSVLWLQAYEPRKEELAQEFHDYQDSREKIKKMIDEVPGIKAAPGMMPALRAGISGSTTTTRYSRMMSIHKPSQGGQKLPKLPASSHIRPRHL